MRELDLAAIVPEAMPTASPALPETQPVPGDGTEPPALAEEADPAPASGDEPPAAEEVEAPKPQGIPVERFKSETAKRRAAERENRELREKLALKSAPDAPAGELSPSNFDSIEKYTAAVKERARAEAATEFEAQTAARKVADRRSQLVKEGKSIEGFDDVIETIFEDNDFPLSKPMADYLLDDADNGALLAKWLTDNPDEAKRISALRPTAATKELTRRDGLLARSAKPISKAPAPTPSVSGSGAAPQAIERMSHDDISKLVRGWNRK